MNQIVVRELKVLLARAHRGRHPVGVLASVGVRGRDQPNFAVENANQVVELLGLVGIS